MYQKTNEREIFEFNIGYQKTNERENIKKKKINEREIF